MHEIILRKAKQSGFSQILNEDNMINQCTTARRLTISKSIDNVLVKIIDSKIRSLFISNIVELPESSMSTLSQDNFKLMRVLDFEDAQINYVPEEVRKLFHLHYLSLKNTKVKMLPKTIGKLLNLETLDFKMTLVSELPIEIKNLKRLCYLVIVRSDSPYFSYGKGTKIQEGFGSLMYLRKLDGVQVNSKALEELKKLRHLRIVGLGQSSLTEDPMRVLHILPNLLWLSLSEAYSGEKLHWFPKLQELLLYGLKGLKCIMIEDGAMPLLERLQISACLLLKEIPDGVENLRNLSCLQFHDMLKDVA
ncbi:hypothetical protein QYF36_004196 [Acer negundo]|nr:hypothetical protein QYF36_004196 [Acer negundo]